MNSNDYKKTPDLDEAGVARRNFLDNAGKLAAYTPPLMMGLLLPGGHAIASGQAPGGGYIPPDPSNYPSGDDDSNSSDDDDGGD